MTRCVQFRRALEATLSGDASAAGLTELGWHEHLLGCCPCRELLEQEEALELLLDSLPEPVLPPGLASRVLVRLRREGAGFERLLDLNEVVVPVGLSARVREGLVDPRAEERLDRLLDRAGQVEIPAGLTGRVLEGLDTAPRASFRLLRGGSSAWRATAAAVLVLGGGALWWATRSDPRSDSGPDHGSRGTEVAIAPDHQSIDELVIAYLPALEYWDELKRLDPLEAAIVANLDEVDGALLEEGR